MSNSLPKAPKLPSNIAALSFEANLVQPLSWLDRVAQLERSAYLAALIAETLRNG